MHNSSYISIFILDTVCQSITDLFTVTIEIMGYTSTVKTFSSHSDVLMISIEYSSNLLCDCSPHGERLDVKKSNFKKMSAFIKAMQEKGLVTVKQLTKGVDSIVKVNRDSHM